MIKPILITSLLAATATTQAQDNQSAASLISQEQKVDYLNIPLKNKLYYGASLGQSNFQFRQDSYSNSVDLDGSNRDAGIKLTFGYEVNQYFALETSYQYFGESFYIPGFSYSSSSYWQNSNSDTKFWRVQSGAQKQQLDGISMDLMFSYPFYQNFAMYLKAGYLGYQYKYSSSSVYQSDKDIRDVTVEERSGSTTDWLRQASIGLNYQFNTFKVFAEYQKLGNDFPYEYEDISSINVGFSIYY